MLIDLIRIATASLLVLIAAIGILFLTRGTSVRRVRGVSADAMPVAPGEAEFPTTVAMLTGGTLVAGNRVELALDGDGTFERLWTDLRAAERSITVQMYYTSAGRISSAADRRGAAAAALDWPRVPVYRTAT